MSTTTHQTSWVNAKNFKVFRHPVPGSFGVMAMRAVATMAENAPPSPDTAYIGFNEKHTMLLILYVRTDGRVDITKAYCPKKARFDVDAVSTSNGRMTVQGLKMLEKLLNSVVVK